jgi:hypothetical protein
MLRVAPVAVPPRPAAAARAKHEDHDDVDDRDQRQKRDVGAVSNPPYPVQEKRTPIPAVKFRRNLGRLVERLVGHSDSRSFKDALKESATR